jgi:hypothetical protein
MLKEIRIKKRTKLFNLQIEKVGKKLYLYVEYGKKSYSEFRNYEDRANLSEAEHALLIASTFMSDVLISYLRDNPQIVK